MPYSVFPQSFVFNADGVSTDISVTKSARTAKLLVRKYAVYATFFNGPTCFPSEGYVESKSI